MRHAGRAIMHVVKLAAFMIFSCASAAAAPVITVDDAGKPCVVDASAWAKLPTQKVEVTEKDQTRHTYAGILLPALLTTCGAPLGDKLKGPALAIAVILEAADGYRVVLGLSEVDAALSGRTMILAQTRDGAPLPPAFAPLALVIPGDTRPTRWIRQIISIRLESTAPRVDETIGPPQPR